MFAFSMCACTVCMSGEEDPARKNTDRLWRIGKYWHTNAHNSQKSAHCAQKTPIFRIPPTYFSSLPPPYFIVIS